MANGRRNNGERVLGSGHLIGLFLGVVLLCCVFYTLGYVMGRSQEASTVRAATVDDLGNSAAPVNRAASAPTIGSASATPAPSPDASAANSGQTASGTDEWNFTPKKANDLPAKPSTTVGAASAPATPARIHSDKGREIGPQPGPDEDLSIPSSTAPAITATPATMVPVPMEQPAGNAASVTLPANYQPPRIPHGAVLLQVAALTSESDALAMASALHQKQFPAFVVPPSGADKYYRVQVGPYSDAHAAKAVRGMLDQAGFRSIIKH